MKNDNNTKDNKKIDNPEKLSNVEFFKNRLKLARKSVKQGLLPLAYINDLKKVIKAFKREGT